MGGHCGADSAGGRREDMKGGGVAVGRKKKAGDISTFVPMGHVVIPLEFLKLAFQRYCLGKERGEPGHWWAGTDTRWMAPEGQ